MKYKTSKEAELRANAIVTEMETLNTEIETAQTEARNEEIETEKRELLITDITAKVEKRDGLKIEYDEAILAQTTLKATETRQFGLLNNVSNIKIEERQGRVDKMDNVLETRAYELAFAKAVRSNDYTEVRALTSTVTDSNAGLLVPTLLANRIADRAKIGGGLAALCSMTQIRGLTEYPIVNSVSDPDIHVEAATVAGTTSKKEKDIVLSSVSIEPQFIAEILRTTDKFEADTIEAFFEWIMTELPDAIMRKLDALIMNGLANGTQGVRGIITNTDVNMVAPLSANVITFNTVNQAIALLDDGVEDGNITIVMNRKTYFNQILGLTGLDGHPINKSTLNYPNIDGTPVVFSSTLPSFTDAIAGQAYMVVGNFNAMRLNFPLGMSPQITRDGVTEADKNIVRYVNKLYVGGNITSLGSLVKVTK